MLIPDLLIYLSVAAILAAGASVTVAIWGYLCLRQANEVHSKTLELANILYARTTRKPGRPRSGVVQRNKETL